MKKKTKIDKRLKEMNKRQKRKTRRKNKLNCFLDLQDSCYQSIKENMYALVILNRIGELSLEQKIRFKHAVSRFSSDLVFSSPRKLFREVYLNMPIDSERRYVYDKVYLKEADECLEELDKGALSLEGLFEEIEQEGTYERKIGVKQKFFTFEASKKKKVRQMIYEKKKKKDLL